MEVAPPIISEYLWFHVAEEVIQVHFKDFYSLQDLTWTALFLAYHQPKLVAGLHQHALSVTINWIKMGISVKKWDCIAGKTTAAAENYQQPFPFCLKVPPAC